ncbi:MAG: hypothetical protein P1P90_03575 [Patescibacteria group bacterium]|nr:hypothetical protein [Patescibacteria group bacterium]
MSPDPFIRDAAFRGSPILSYGTANRGSAWPKFLALAAGIFVLLFVFIFSWFWFFTKIPVPKNTLVFTILPAETSLNTNAPLVWKQAQALNNPFPTVAGLAKSSESNKNHQDGNLGYAIRLSPATAIIGKTKLWDLSSEQILEIDAYKSPFDVFGWPWEMFNGQMKLDINVRGLFSYGELSLDELPSKIDGIVIGNKWKTTLPIQKSVSEPTKKLVEASGFLQLEDGDSQFLMNFLRYHQSWAQFTEPGMLTWRHDPLLVALDYEADNKQKRYLGSLEDKESTISKKFELPDGYIAERLYVNPGLTIATGSNASSTGLNIPETQQGLISVSNFVSGLTGYEVDSNKCDGEVIAGFNQQSIKNFCSWIDICYFDFDNIILINEGGYLTACGY